MNEFLPRTESVPAIGRTPEPRLIVHAASGAGTAQAQGNADVRIDAQTAERSAISATYQRLRADIANVLADLPSRRRPAGGQVAHAETALLSLMPQPVIVLPMPPTDPQMLAFVAQVARSVAQKAVEAQAAQANAPASLAAHILSDVSAASRTD